jgi:hypothetical protein
MIETLRRPGWRTVLLAVLIAALLCALAAAAVFGMRTYRSFVVLRAAHQLGADDVGQIRPWMTLRYVARAYRVPEPELAAQLGLPPSTDPHLPLHVLAQQQHRNNLDYVLQVQRAVAAIRRGAAPPAGGPPSSG